MSRLSTRMVAVLAAAAIAAGVLASAVATAPPAAAAFPDGQVRFEGHGWGHGRGLGQYGSYGYAVEESRPYSWIVDHFYGGTTKGSRADGIISVKLELFNGTTSAPTDMVVTSGSAFAIGSNNYTAGEYSRVRWNGSGWSIERAASCGGPWTEVQAVDPNLVSPEAKTDYGGDDITKMLTILQPDATKACTSWNKRTYRGSLMIARLDGTFTRVLNWVPMEQYLRGVVPRESPASWGDAGGGKGMEALKAQSVAARSYAWAENRHAGYKTCDTTTCQVYGGAALNGVRSEDSRTDAAIAATAGEVRVSGASVSRTEFSSSTGGHTDGPTFTPVVDTGDDTPSNPNHRWSASVSSASIEGRYPQIGTLDAVRVLARNGFGDMGGRVTKVQLVGTKGSVTLEGDGSIRGGLGIKSSWFNTVDIVLDITRLQGADRIATSNAISASLFADGAAAAAVIVSARDFPDAILGVPLAVAKNGPILLSDAAAVPASTMAELQRATGGGKPVYLLGGTVPLSDGVRTQLEGAGYQVTRYGGATRAATAVQVAEALGNRSTVLLATGSDFPDALAAGAAAAKAGAAVLLTSGSTMAPETAAYLQGRTVTRYAVGGGAAAADPGATRLAGPDRYETALAVANKFFPGPVAAGLASGAGFADALSGGVHAAMKGGPLVLTAPTTLPISTKQYLQGNADVTLRTLYVYGGTGAISDAALADIKKR